MGNFIIGYNFSSYTPTCANEDSDYPIVNLYEYSHTKRHFRTQSDTASKILIDQGATNTLSAIVINDVNFATCTITGGSDTNATAFSTSITIPLDERVQRYKVYHPLPVDYRYIAITLPATMAITDTNTVYRIGTIVLLDTIITLTKMPTEYTYSAVGSLKTNEGEGGWYEDVRIGDKCWQADLSFTLSDSTAVEAQLWTINAMRRNQDIVFYEGDTADKGKVYVCRRRTAVEINKEPGALFTPDRMTFRELL